jgi:hypothetical protein
MITMELSDKQYDAIDNDYEETFYIGGIGSGKTFVLGVFVYNEARLKGSVGLITAPVFDTLNNSTLPELKNVWSQLGLYEGIHYVIGSMPPKEWNIPNYTNRNGKILTWRWGSYSILDGSDNFNKHLGLQLDYVAADEFRDVKIGAWDKYRGRMRGKAKKALRLKYKMLAVTTPPDDPNKIEKLLNDRVNVIYGTSFDNAKNLPEGYLEGLIDKYDEITYNREVLGQMIHLGGSVTYHAFSDANIVKQDFVPNAPTVMAWDFNASAKKPMSTGLIQEIGGKYYLTKEFIFKNSNTDEQCKKVLEFFKSINFSGTLEVTGDYSGHRHESNASRSDYAIIEHYFSNYADYRNKTRPTLAIRDRVASLNTQFLSMGGERKLWIDVRCVKTIEDLHKTRWKESGQGLDDTEPERTHPSDMLSYWAYNYFPIDRKAVVYG